MNHLRSIIGIALLSLVLGACGKGDAGGPPPEKPFTGAPVAFEVTAVKKEALSVRVYNFSDKAVAQYSIFMKYFDDSGKVIVEPGPFAKEHDFWSMSGKKFLVEPKSWASFEIDHLEIPAGAVKAEVIARSVTALKDDGNRFEEDPLWELEGMDWPKDPNSKAAEAPAAEPAAAPPAEPAAAPPAEPAAAPATEASDAPGAAPTN